MNSSYNLPVNIGNPEEITILDIAKKIKDLTNSKSKLIFKPLPSDDPTNRKPDITKAKYILKWKPEICLTDGLINTINYYKEKFDIEI